MIGYQERGRTRVSYSRTHLPNSIMSTHTVYLAISGKKPFSLATLVFIFDVLKWIHLFQLRMKISSFATMFLAEMSLKKLHSLLRNRMVYASLMSCSGWGDYQSSRSPCSMTLLQRAIFNVSDSANLEYYQLLASCSLWRIHGCRYLSKFPWPGLSNAANYSITEILRFHYPSTNSAGACAWWAAKCGVSGGPAGYIYGFLFVWGGYLAVYASLSELASMSVICNLFKVHTDPVDRAPLAGGQYHWVSMLAPPKVQKALSYTTGQQPNKTDWGRSNAINGATGWLTLIGWQGIFAAVNYVESKMIQALIVLTRPEYVPQRWHQMLFYWAATIFAVLVNIATSTVLPRFEGFALPFCITGFFAILIPLITLGAHQSPGKVFHLWMNQGEFPTQGLSFMVGLVGTAQTILGVDGAIHVSVYYQALPLWQSLILSRCPRKSTMPRRWYLGLSYHALWWTVL